MVIGIMCNFFCLLLSLYGALMHQCSLRLLLLLLLLCYNNLAKKRQTCCIPGVPSESRLVVKARYIWISNIEVKTLLLRTKYSRSCTLLSLSLCCIQYTCYLSHIPLSPLPLSQQNKVPYACSASTPPSSSPTHAPTLDTPSTNSPGAKTSSYPPLFLPFLPPLALQPTSTSGSRGPRTKLRIYAVPLAF